MNTSGKKPQEPNEIRLPSEIEEAYTEIESRILELAKSDTERLKEYFELANLLKEYRAQFIDILLQFCGRSMPLIFDHDFGDMLKAVRKECGFNTQRSLAAAMHVKTQSVTDAEAHGSVGDFLRKLSKESGLPIEVIQEMDHEQLTLLLKKHYVSD